MYNTLSFSSHILSPAQVQRIQDEDITQHDKCARQGVRIRKSGTGKEGREVE
jgi:hypothetical protein